MGEATIQRNWLWKRWHCSIHWKVCPQKPADQPLSNAQAKNKTASQRVSKSLRLFGSSKLILSNSIKLQNVPSRSPPASQPTPQASQDSQIAKSPATASQPKSKVVSQSQAKPQPKETLLSFEPEMSPVPSLDSDYGFTSQSEYDEPVRRNFPLSFQFANYRMQPASSSRTRNTIPLDCQNHSPRSEDGGAALNTFLPSIARPWTPAETSTNTETIKLNSPNRKILGKFIYLSIDRS